MLNQAAISGSPKEGIYSQTLIVENFFLVLSLEGPPEEVNLELGRNTLSKIEEIISQTLTITPKELAEMQIEAFSDGIKPNILVAKIEHQKLSLASFGEVSAKIFRKGKIISLFGKPVSSIQYLAGTVLHGDLLLLSTASFLEQIPSAKLSSLANLSPAEIRDQILPEVESLDDNSHTAALLLKVDLQNLSDEEEPEKISGEPVGPQASPTAIPPVFSQPRPIPPRSLPEFPDLVSRILNLASHSPRSLYLHRPHDPNAPAPASRKVLYLALIILITLVSLIVFQLRSRVLEERARAVQDISSQIQNSLDSETKLSGLNDQIARDILMQTRRDAVAKAVQTFGPNWQKDTSSEAQKLQQVFATLDQQITLVSKIYNLSVLDLYYDFSLLKSGAKITSLWAHNDEAVALDQADGAVYSLSLTTKNAAIVTGGEDFKQGKFIDFTGNTAYVWTPTGILSIDRSQSPAVSQQILKSSDKWGTIQDLKIFAGNVYLLDSQNNQVWKYQNTDLGFTDITNYLDAGMPLDFQNVKAMAIDGSVYILTATGNIAEFSGGTSVDFAITGLDPALKAPTAFFTNNEVNNLYVLDSNAGRVVVLNKKGGYMAQYLLPVSSLQSPVSSLVADESLHKVFLFAGAKVYSFDLH